MYRGEPECYSVVSSGLFRECRPDSENEAFDIARVEEEMVEDARQYTTLANDNEILTEIQHFGGATNLIDFTDDYLIALFFASIESERGDGRVVLHWPEPNAVVKPKHTLNRIVSQKSVFVRPPRGFIVPDASEETVVVPADLKGSILTFLERFHGISEATVYNDIHGFIRHQTPSRSRYARTFRELPSDAEIPEAYHGRGNAYSQRGKADRAVADLEKALRLSPTLAAAFIDRGTRISQAGRWRKPFRITIRQSRLCGWGHIGALSV